MHTLADLDQDRAAVAHHVDRAARTCALIREMLALRDDDRAKAEFDALINEVTSAGVALHNLLGNRALFARADALEARGALAKMREAADA